MRKDRMRSRPDLYLSTSLVNILLMRCIRNMTDVELLEDEILLLKKSVCIVRI